MPEISEYSSIENAAQNFLTKFRHESAISAPVLHRYWIRRDYHEECEMKQWICAMFLLGMFGLSACDWGNQREDDERSVLNQDRDEDNGRYNDRDGDDDDRDRRGNRDDDDD